MKMFFAAAALASIAIPASAEEVSMDVRYSDLDLATSEGQKKLDWRINQAARKACGAGKSRTGTRIPSRETQACVAELKASAHKQFAAIIEREQKGG